MTSKRKRKRKKNQDRPVPQLDILEQINLNAAGLDIGAAEIWACVPEGREETNVRVFETFTVDLYALADWLEACGIETVAMESTGIYWIPIYEILEDRGFEVFLVNARHINRKSVQSSTKAAFIFAYFVQSEYHQGNKICRNREER